MDTVALSALILSILGLVGGVILKLHLSHCKSGCMESDCTKRNSNDTDITEIETVIPVESVV